MTIQKTNLIYKGYASNSEPCQPVSQKANPMSESQPTTTRDQSEQTGTALLVVDVQKGFICFSTSHIPSMVQRLQHKYETVMVTQFFNQEGSFFRSLLKWDRLKRDSEEFELAFTPVDRALRVLKSNYSCVNQSFLEILEHRSIQRLDICGIDTDICVTKCAVDLFENGIEPVVLKEYCNSTGGKAAHLNGLKTLERFIGSSQIQ